MPSPSSSLVDLPEPAETDHDDQEQEQEQEDDYDDANTADDLDESGNMDEQ